jgi:hypothetical protein
MHIQKRRKALRKAKAKGKERAKTKIGIKAKEKAKTKAKRKEHIKMSSQCQSQRQNPGQIKRPLLQGKPTAQLLDSGAGFTPKMESVKIQTSVD